MFAKGWSLARCLLDAGHVPLLYFLWLRLRPKDGLSVFKATDPSLVPDCLQCQEVAATHPAVLLASHPFLFTLESPALGI